MHGSGCSHQWRVGPVLFVVIWGLALTGLLNTTSTHYAGVSMQASDAKAAELDDPLNYRQYAAQRGDSAWEGQQDPGLLCENTCYKVGWSSGCYAENTAELAGTV